MLDEVSILFDLGLYELSWNKRKKDQEEKGPAFLFLENSEQLDKIHPGSFVP